MTEPVPIDPAAAKEEIQRRNQEASEWMHRGMDLLPETAPAKLEEAVGHFDRAIALRKTLPLAENPFLRYGLSAGWINRGDAFARIGTAAALNEAVHSYDEALALLESLPLGENILYPRRLAIARLNRGVALQRQEPPRDRDAAAMYRATLDLLALPEAAPIDDFLPLRAGAWANLAGALAAPGADGEEALAAVHEALAVARPGERDDLLFAEAGFKARHALCRLVLRDAFEGRPLSDALAAEATDAVEEALALARHWKVQGRNEFDGVARGLFRVGCWIYGRSHPRFLAEFISDALAAGDFPESEIAEAALAVIGETLATVEEDDVRAGLLALAQRLQRR